MSEPTEYRVVLVYGPDGDLRWGGVDGPYTVEVVAADVPLKSLPEDA